MRDEDREEGRIAPRESSVSHVTEVGLTLRAVKSHWRFRRYPCLQSGGRMDQRGCPDWMMGDLLDDTVDVQRERTSTRLGPGLALEVEGSREN